MIMEANFSDAKMKLGNEIITVKRGQSAMSIRSWADLFGTGVKATTNFLDMLQKDGMISRQTVGKGKQSTTLINIENYDLFQGTEETQAQREGNASATQAQREGHTIEEGNKGIKKEGNNTSSNEEDIITDEPIFDFKKSLLSLGIESSILSQWMKVRKNKKAVNTEIAFKGIEREIKASGRSPNECIVIAVERSWAGFKAEWLNNNQTNNNGSQFTTTTGQSNFKGPTMGQRLDEAKRRAKERRMQQGSGGTSDASDEFASYTDA